MGKKVICNSPDHSDCSLLSQLAESYYHRSRAYCVFAKMLLSCRLGLCLALRYWIGPMTLFSITGPASSRSFSEIFWQRWGFFTPPNVHSTLNQCSSKSPDRINEPVSSRRNLV